MTLPKSLITVTTFSKILAAVLFVLLPFLGFYLGMEYEKRIIQDYTESHTTIVRTTPKLTTNPTSDWKTYTNTKYEYSLSYPESWIVFEAKSLEPTSLTPPSTNQEQNWQNTLLTKGELQKVTFQDPTAHNKGYFYIVVENNPSNLPLDKIAYTYCCIQSPDPSKYLPVEDITLDGRPAKKIILSEFGYETNVIVLIKNNLIYKITAVSYYEKDDLDKERFNKLFDQILSTFKFTQ